MAKPLLEALNYKPAPKAPRFQPKLTVRVTCGRTKQIMEFTVDMPVEGESPAVFDECGEKMRDILTSLGILRDTREKAEESKNA